MIISLMLSCGKDNTGDKPCYNDTNKIFEQKKDSQGENLSNRKMRISDSIITNLKTDEKIIALTFDACETKTPSFFDDSILNFLINEEIPCTIFLSGKFTLRNADRIKELSKLSFIEFENHSFNHFQNMEKLDDEQIIKEVTETEKIIFKITGKRTKFFRFPAGNYNKKSFDVLINLNYNVVHWSFASGDADKGVSKKKLYNWIIYNTKPGSILIFHINGRGYKTGEILPELVSYLRENQYKFLKLEDFLDCKTR